MIYDRIVYESILEDLRKGKIIILYGARQVGKTTIIQKLLSEQDSKSLFLSWDDLDTQLVFAENRIESLKNIVWNNKIIAIDEAQKIPDIGTKLKILYESFPSVQFIATGSSSFELANRINEPLTGRIYNHLLYPLSIWEFKINNFSNFEIQKKLENLMIYGNYPYITNSKDPTREIKTITSQYLYQDILSFAWLQKTDQLVQLLQLLALQIWSEVSYHELSKTLWRSSETVAKYINILEKSFIIVRLSAWSKNIRNEISKNQKIYFWDCGIRNSIINNFNPLAIRTDVGALWENFFVTERLKSNSNSWKFVNSYFWRTYNQQEIDYIEENNWSFELFECKWNPNKKQSLPKPFSDNYKVWSWNIINPKNFVDFL